MVFTFALCRATNNTTINLGASAFDPSTGKYQHNMCWYLTANAIRIITKSGALPSSPCDAKKQMLEAAKMYVLRQAQFCDAELDNNLQTVRDIGVYGAMADGHLLAPIVATALRCNIILRSAGMPQKHYPSGVAGCRTFVVDHTSAHFTLGMEGLDFDDVLMLGRSLGASDQNVGEVMDGLENFSGGVGGVHVVESRVITVGGCSDSPRPPTAPIGSGSSPTTPAGIAAMQRAERERAERAVRAERVRAERAAQAGRKVQMEQAQEMERIRGEREQEHTDYLYALSLQFAS